MRLVQLDSAKVRGGGGKDDPLELNTRAMPPFAALRAFEAVGRLGGVRRAAQALSLDHAVVSRHLRALEEWAGVPLVNRLHGGALLTEEGMHYHARISSAIADIVRASADLTRRGESPTLNIWCAPDFAFRWLTAPLAGFRAENSHLDVELHPADRAPDLSRHEADADIRYVPLSQIEQAVPAGVQCLELARPRVMALASPTVVPSRTLQPRDVLSLPLLHEANDSQWLAWFTAHGVKVEGRIPGPRLWHAHVTLHAARRGQGITLGNHFLLDNDLNTGRLVELVSPSDGFPPIILGGYFLFARRDRWRTDAISRFRTWLARAMAEHSQSEPS
jgi:LysR family glycine cleavage system transcriptional activator